MKKLFAISFAFLVVMAAPIYARDYEGPGRGGNKTETRKEIQTEKRDDVKERKKEKRQKIRERRQSRRDAARQRRAARKRL